MFKNAAGEFVAPDSAGTSAFLGGGTIKDNGTVDVDFVKSIKGAYPIGTASYALAYASWQRSCQAKGGIRVSNLHP